MEKLRIELGNITKEDIRNLQESIGGLYDTKFDLKFVEDYKKSINSLYREVLSQLDFSFLNELKQVLKNNILNSVKDMIDYDFMIEIKEKLFNLSNNLVNIQIEQIEKLSNIDFKHMISSEFIDPDFYRESFHVANKVAQEEFVVKGTEENNSLESEFSDTEELEMVINEHISNPRGFQERVANWSQEKIVKYFIIWQIICFIWSNFLQPYFQENIGVPVTAQVVSKVKQLPEKGAEIICQLKENIVAIIKENTSYYYKISFIDENSIEREGYVAKRNLKLLNEETDLNK